MAVSNPALQSGANLAAGTSLVAAPQPGVIRLLNVAEAGFEELTLFETAVPDAMTLEIVLGPAVAGLRQTGRTLELLDEAGTPLLRMAPPMAIGSDGRRFDLSVQVHGCAADQHAALPWGRPVVPPGSRECVVHIGLKGLQAPALVDPLWTATGSMAEARYDHASVLLQGGKVLVVGGRTEFGPIASAEAYDPATGTWASAGSLGTAREGIVMTALSGGRAMVIGGRTTSIVSSTDIYAPPDGWSAGPSMQVPRFGHAAAALTDGRILVAGGQTQPFEGEPPLPTASAEMFDGSWKSVGSLAAARVNHALVALANARALVAGGTSPTGSGNNPTYSAAVFDPTALSWTAVDSAPQLVSDAVGITLGTNKALIAGTAMPIVFDGAQLKWSVTSGPLPVSHEKAFAALQGGGAVATSGWSQTKPKAAWSLSPSDLTWSHSGDLLIERWGASATLLPSGQVLVAGGYDSLATHASAELFARLANGAPCTSSGECVSAHCVDGVCCNLACTDLCRACTTAKKGKGNDGVCEPIGSGSDPDQECLDDGSPACQHDGACDGSGFCRFYSQPQGCSPSLCLSDADCSSGHCAEGICCDQACGSPCQSCLASKKGGGVNGLCEPVKAGGADPKNGCPKGPAGSCGPDGLCDGAGACRWAAPEDQACGKQVCTAGILYSYACDGVGSCLMQTPVACGGALGCAPSADKCLGQCVTAADCKPGHACDSGSCVALLADGLPCDAPNQCTSGSCVDGVCCASACNQCEACNVAGPTLGKCTPIEGAPRPGRQPCHNDHEDCQGRCDGHSPTCAYPSAESSCGSVSCQGDTLVSPRCNGSGQCVQSVTECHMYACDPDKKACRTSCMIDNDCSGGRKCDVSTKRCVVTPWACSPQDDMFLMGADGELVSCGAYRCRAGQCLSRCADDADCASGLSCRDETCKDPALPPPEPVELDKGCDCTVPGGSRRDARHGLAGFALAAIAAEVIRRRTTRRGNQPVVQGRRES